MIKKKIYLRPQPAHMHCACTWHFIGHRFLSYLVWFALPRISRVKCMKQRERMAYVKQSSRVAGVWSRKPSGGCRRVRPPCRTRMAVGQDVDLFLRSWPTPPTSFTTKLSSLQEAYRVGNTERPPMRPCGRTGTISALSSLSKCSLSRSLYISLSH